MLREHFHYVNALFEEDRKSPYVIQERINEMWDRKEAFEVSLREFGARVDNELE